MERKWSAPANRPIQLIRVFMVILIVAALISSYFYYMHPSTLLLVVTFFIVASVGYMLMKLRFFATYSTHSIIVSPNALIIDEIDNWTYSSTPQPLFIPLHSIRMLDYRASQQRKIVLRATVGKQKINFGRNFTSSDLKEIALTLSGSTYLSNDLQALLGIAQERQKPLDVDDLVNFAVDKFKDYIQKR